MKIGKMKKEVRIILIFALIIVIVSGGLTGKSEDSFSVNAVFLKSVIKQGGTVTNNLRITNLAGFEQNFQIHIRNFENLAFLSQDSFILTEGGSKEITITFKDTFLEEPGVYVGALAVKSDYGKEKEIPVILEIQSKEILFATNLDVASKYKEVIPGEQISVGIKLFNLNDTKTHTLQMLYSINNIDGENIFSETENVIVGTEAVLSKTFAIPEDTSLGNYVFAVITKYDASAGTSSYLFSVSKKTKSLSLGNLADNLNYFVILIFAFLFGILALVAYMIYDRNKMFRELRRQHITELRFYTKQIEKQKKISLAKTKAAPEREKIIRRFGEIEKKAVKKIKKRQRKQRVIFKRLGKEKKKDEMRKKLGQWKKQGYKMFESWDMEKIPKAHIKKKIKDWKKRGYDTRVLGQ